MTEQLFFELIRVSIGTQGMLSRMPSAQEWQALYEMAKKQSLVGVCFAGVKKVLSNSSAGGEDCSAIGLPEMLYLKWVGMAAKIQKRNEVMNRQCVELQERLRKDGFRNYIMKGQVNAALYGELQMLRQSGDIDVYLEGGLDKVLTYAKTFGKVEHVNELEMSVPVFEDTEVEFHYRPFIMRNPFKNKRLQAFFKSQEEACLSNTISLGKGLTICAPTTEFNLVHQLAHIHLHLFTEGIGMRQLMDYYFVLRNTNSSALRAKCKRMPSGHELPTNFSSIISDLGLNRFASALMWVLLYVLEGNESINHKSSSINLLWEPNEEDGRFLLNEIMTSGNFGKHNEEQNERKGKMGYSVWALFFRNLRLSRFDRGDWFWGPLWRISHKLTRKKI